MSDRIEDQLKIDKSDGSVLTLKADTTNASIGTLTTHPLDFQTDDVPRLRIDRSGNVGIGTQTPKDKLEVNGSLRVSDAIATNQLSVTGSVTTPLTLDRDLAVNGNIKIVGIGTKDPQGKLTIFDNSSRQINLNRWADLSASGGGQGLFAGNAYVRLDDNEKGTLFNYSNKHESIGAIGFAVNYPHWNTASVISSNSTDSTKDPEFRPSVITTFTYDGKVGIGTESPGVKLEVSGDIQAAGKLSSQNGRVKRDFVSWNTGRQTSDPIHIKTNIPKQSDVMYRILVEGYNYGTSAAVNSDIVGYTYHEWENIGKAQANNYADGVSISQYYSSDGYVVIKLTTNNTYYIGFSASAWLTNPTGTGFDISATVHHQAGDL